MREVILIKNGELVLKGLNRYNFEDRLVKNMRRSLKELGAFQFTKAQSTMMVEAKDEDVDMDDVCDVIGHVFGIAAYSRAAITEKDLDEIKKVTIDYLADQLRDVKTFKVESKRSDKKFLYKSPEISREVGGYILSKFHHLKVDVHNPDIIVTVEVRDKYAFIHGNSIKGAGGMPVGTSGRGAILISGGIDSPVAAYMMAKRGVELIAIHFASPPYTTEYAEDKVRRLLQKVSKYSGSITMYTVPFTKIQESIRDNCHEDYFTLIMRRYMMRISQIIAEKQRCHALITGESVGQVASQTMMAIECTDAVTKMPVYRPCIGLDKNEIVTISRKIDTFETSIEPYEDCCTVFTPKHPKTKPKVYEVEDAEKPILNSEELIKEAVENTVKIVIS